MKSIDQEQTNGPLSTGAIGDAYGYVFEFADSEFISEFNDLSFHKRPYSNLPLGVYSDDTQMHMAIAEVIATDRDWTPLEIASSFVNVFHRDPRPGYAGGFYKFLNQTTTGEDFLKNIIPHSERNGAAMRAPIIGLYPDLNEVMTRSEIQAKITHNTKVGIDSAIASSLLCHFFAYNLGSKEEAPAFLERHVPGHNWVKPWKGMVEIHGIATVRAALTAITKTDSLADLLKACVNFTGDVDSVATIALASASMAQGIKKDIPANLWQGLEQHQFGLNYLINLDSKVREVVRNFKS
jgi:ADP-ribosylglycohydrolase